MMWNLVQSVCVSILTVAVYSYWFHDDVPAQQIAVVNYDASVSKLGDSPTPEQVNDVMSDLQQKASRLSAAGFVVVDSRVLVSYPQANEVPGLEFKPANEKSSAGASKSAEPTPVNPEAFDE